MREDKLSSSVLELSLVRGGRDMMEGETLLMSSATAQTTFAQIGAWVLRQLPAPQGRNPASAEQRAVFLYFHNRKVEWAHAANAAPLGELWLERAPVPCGVFLFDCVAAVHAPLTNALVDVPVNLSDTDAALRRLIRLRLGVKEQDQRLAINGFPIVLNDRMSMSQLGAIGDRRIPVTLQHSRRYTQYVTESAGARGTCALCFTAMTQLDVNRLNIARLPSRCCGHRFHLRCAKQWVLGIYRRRSRPHFCPVCRAGFQVDDITAAVNTDAIRSDFYQ